MKKNQLVFFSQLNLQIEASFMCYKLYLLPNTWYQIKMYCWHACLIIAMIMCNFHSSVYQFTLWLLYYFFAHSSFPSWQQMSHKYLPIQGQFLTQRKAEKGTRFGLLLQLFLSFHLTAQEPKEPVGFKPTLKLLVGGMQCHNHYHPGADTYD